MLRGAVPDGLRVVGRVPRPRRRRSTPPRADARADAVQPDDLCDILFTSGTTGAPKGAMLLPRARASARTTRGPTSSGSATGDRYLIINPFFHTFGLKAGILACAPEGRDDHPAPGVRRPRGDAPRASRSAITHAARAAGDLPDDPQPPDLDEFDLSTLRLVGHRRRPRSPSQMIIDMREKLGFETVVTGYGLTETHGHRHDVPPRRRPRDHRQHRRAAPIPGVEVRVVDDERQRACPPASRARSSCAATT